VKVELADAVEVVATPLTWSRPEVIGATILDAVLSAQFAGGGGKASSSTSATTPEVRFLARR
jgi:hypothetical protein